MPQRQTRVLITGATGAIGRAIVKAFACSGAKLSIHYNDNRRLAMSLMKQARSQGARAHAISADLSQIGEPERLVAESVGNMGGLDLLVHAAASFERTPFGTVTDEQWMRMAALNMKAPFFLAQEAALAMGKSGGAMIFMSDVAATTPYGGYLPYCMSKGAIDSLVRGLAKALAPKISVNAVAPYLVSRPKDVTDREWNELLNKSLLRRAAKPDEVASLVKKIAELSDSMTGQVVAVDGGRLLG